MTKPVRVSGNELLLNLDTGAQGVVLVDLLLPSGPAQTAGAIQDFGLENAGKLSK